jgi:hypothetical protein
VSYNGSGTFNINTAGQPVVTGTVISSTAFNALTADLGTGLSTALTKDGQTVATARIPFAQGINSSLVTDATSTTTGSIITAGGVGIAKALYVGTTLNVTGASTLAGITGTFNGTVGATTPSTGAFTTLSATATNAGITINTVANTNFGQLNFNTTNGVLFQAFDSAYATSGSAMANSLRIYSTGANGVNVVDTASGGLNYYDSATKAVGISPSGLKMFAGYNIGVGAATPTTSGAGITFPATQSASTDANTLDDYEEGTWTPAMSTTTGSISFSSASGTYTKIGRMVYVRGSFGGTVTISSPTGDLKLTSLPFTIGSPEVGAGSTAPYNMSAGAYFITLETIGGTTTAYIFNFANGTRSSAHSYFQTGCALNISMCYQI